MILGSIPATLYSDMLILRSSIRSFKLDEGLMKTMTNYKLKVGHFNPQARNITRVFAEEKNFEIKIIGRPSTKINLIYKY